MLFDIFGTGRPGRTQSTRTAYFGSRSTSRGLPASRVRSPCNHFGAADRGANTARPQENLDVPRQRIQLRPKFRRKVLEEVGSEEKFRGGFGLGTGHSG